MIADIGTRRGSQLEDVDYSSFWINGILKNETTSNKKFHLTKYLKMQSTVTTQIQFRCINKLSCQMKSALEL